MKVEYLKDKLKWAIATAEKITGKNLSLPALAYVLLSAKNRQLTVQATNLDLGIKITLPVKVEEEGQVMVSGVILANFLSSLFGDNKITLSTSTNTLSVATTGTASVLKTYPTDDFPTIPTVTEGEMIKLPATQFLAGLRAVSYAASLSDIKPEIASVYIYHKTDELIFVATDSFRLAEKRLPLKQKITVDLALIIPIKNITEILRVFDGIDEELTLTYSHHQVAFATEQIYLTSRLVEGLYPDYQQIMPTNQMTEAVISKTELLNTLRLATIFSGKLNQINFKILTKEKLLEITSRDSDIGESSSRLAATLDGENVEISFNIRYLLDCLQSVTTDNVNLAFNGKQRPILVRGVGVKTFTYLIMPLNR